MTITLNTGYQQFNIYGNNEKIPTATCSFLQAIIYFSILIPYLLKFLSLGKGPRERIITRDGILNFKGAQESAPRNLFRLPTGAGNRVGIVLSYRPSGLYSLAELISWNRFLGSLKV
jgi:hypothetical protein